MKNRLPAESSVIGADNHTGPVIIKKATRSATADAFSGAVVTAIQDFELGIDGGGR